MICLPQGIGTSSRCPFSLKVITMTENRIFPYISDSFDDLPSVMSNLGLSHMRAVIVGDTNTLPLYGSAVSDVLSGCVSRVSLYELRGGEENKTMDDILPLLEFMVSEGLDRGDCVIALGGGVVGDMAGLAASLYMRGIAVIQLPTSLLAQVDSSMGGKTGVDLLGYKNMIGAFHMPELVYTNVSTLSSLPEIQFRQGLGEVVKTAVIRDGELFDILEDRKDEVLGRGREVMLDIIKRSAMVKADIVAEDPRENGVRTLLNLGHTIGHAVEKATHFCMPHGMCVSAGLAAAANISAARGMLREADRERILALLTAFGLPVKISGPDAGQIMGLTRSDKKMKAGTLRFILPVGTGESVICTDITDDELLYGISSILEEEI